MLFCSIFIDILGRFVLLSTRQPSDSETMKNLLFFSTLCSNYIPHHFWSCCFLHSDWPAALTGCISVIAEINRSNGRAEGCGPVGNPNPLHTQTAFFCPPPCRPGTCVTYNWFINNVNRCFWSGLAPRHLVSILFYCHRPPDCIPLNVHWHRREEGDVFLIPRGKEGDKH